MNDTELLRRLRLANPITRHTPVDPAELATLDARLEPMELAMTTTHQRIEKQTPAKTRDPRLRRPWQVVATAMAVALLLIGIPILLFFSSDGTEPADAPPEIPTTIEQHLGAACANVVAAGPDGTVWVLGPGVLQSYDGISWTEAPSPPERTLPECGMAAAAVSSGIWLADADGTHLYSAGEWLDVAMPDDPMVLGDDFFVDLAATLDGQVYAAGVNMLWRFDGTGFVAVEGGEGSESIETAPDGSLWAHGGQELKRYDGVEWTTAANTAWVLFDVVAIEPDGAAWLSPIDASIQEGVGIPGDEEVIRFDGERFVAYSIRHVTDAVVTDGSVWLGVRSQMPFEYRTHSPDPQPGLYRLVDGEWYRITTADGLAGDEITSLAVATDGSLWVGTQTGVSRIVVGTEPIGTPVDVTVRETSADRGPEGYVDTTPPPVDTTPPPAGGQ